MKRPESSNDNHDEVVNDNIQKRLKNLFAGKEPPTHMSIRDVEAMQARILELETKLAQKSGQVEGASRLVPEEAPRAQTVMTLPGKSSFISDGADADKSAKKQSAWKKFLEPVAVQRSEAKRQMRLLAWLLSITLAFFLFGAVFILLTAEDGDLGFMLLGVSIVLGVALGAARTNYYQIAAVFVLGTLSLAILGSPLGRGASSTTAFFSATIWLVLPILLASAFLSARGLALFSALNLVGLLMVGSIVKVDYPSIVQVASLIVLTAGLALALARHRDQVEADRLSELTERSDQLRVFSASLDEKVTDRTQELTLAVEVGQRIAIERNLDTLLVTAVELICSRFDLYYVQVYLADTAKTKLTLRAGSGEAGKALLRRGHALPIGSGSINGSAAFERRTVVISDTSQSDTFLPNPLLPDTCSEMAVPLLVGDDLKGVLNIQSSQPGFLTEQNRAVFETLSSQLSLAVDNATLFNEAIQTRKEVEGQARRLVREGWGEFLDAITRRERIGYTASGGDLQAMHNFSDTAERKSAIVRPISLLGESIGAVRLEFDEDQAVKVDDEIVDAIARQVANQVENLRLLAQEDQSRLEAEQVVRGVTRDTWENYLASHGNGHVGFVYDQADVKPFERVNGRNGKDATAFGHPIRVRGEEIGELAIEGAEELDENAQEFIEEVAGRLSAYIENVRLFEETEQRRIEAEALLRELDSQKFAMDQHSIVGITDQTGKILYANDKFVEISKYSREELIGQDHRILNSGHHSKEFMRNLWVMIANGKVWHGEILNKAKDGSLYWVDSTIVPFLNEEGKPIRYVAIRTDITERKQAELALQEGEARLRTLIENAPEAIIVVDLTTGLFTDPNENAVKLYGLSREDLTKVGPAEMSPPEQPDGRPSTEKAMEKIGEAMQGGAPVFEWIHRNAQGRDIPCEVRLVRLPGDLPQVRASVTDITERKRAQEIIARRATELETAAQVSAAASTVLDTKNLLQTVVDLTKSKFGLYHAHIYLLDDNEENLVLTAGAGEVGKQMTSEGWQIPFQQETSLVAQAARTLQGVIVNDVAATPAFMPNPLLPDTRSEMAIPMIVGNRVLGVLDVQSDRLNAFTDEDVRIQIVLASQVAATLQNVRFYEELQQTAQQLKEVDRLKNEFLSNMSHELRTPLNSVLGYAEVLMTGLDGELNEEQNVDVQAIYENGNHLLNLINDVLDLAKIEAGRMALKTEEVRIAELLEQVKKNSLGLVHRLKKPLEIVTEVAPDLPIIVADPVRISQIFNNLVSNAVKFSEQGTISVRAYRIDGWLSVDVKDEGIGINPDDKEKIFERFTQADGSTTRRAEGTGLGLPITYHLVAMHGGTISVQSEPGKGSTFTVQLPITQQKPALA